LPARSAGNRNGIGPPSSLPLGHLPFLLFGSTYPLCFVALSLPFCSKEHFLRHFLLRYSSRSLVFDFPRLSFLIFSSHSDSQKSLLESFQIFSTFGGFRSIVEAPPRRLFFIGFVFRPPGFNTSSLIVVLASVSSPFLFPRVVRTLFPCLYLSPPSEVAHQFFSPGLASVPPLFFFLLLTGLVCPAYMFWFFFTSCMWD